MTTEQHGSKTEGRGDDLAHQERMAELEREIVRLEQLLESRQCSCIGCEFDRQTVAKYRSRLRNEGGGEEATRKVRPPTESELALVAYHSRHASPSDLPAREAIERVAAYLQSEELMQKWDGWRKMIAEGNTGSYPRDCFEAEMSSIAEQISALLQPLSQGNGEAVAWHNPDLEHDAEEYECAMKMLDDMGVPRADERGVVFSLVGRIKKVAPPSQPEGLREALERARSSIDGVIRTIKAGTTKDTRAEWENGSIQLLKSALGNIATALRTPSRGPVEAAEWLCLPWSAVPSHVAEGPTQIRARDGWLVCELSGDGFADFIVRLANETALRTSAKGGAG